MAADIILKGEGGTVYPLESDQGVPSPLLFKMVQGVPNIAMWQ